LSIDAAVPRETWTLTSIGPEVRFHGVSVSCELLGGVKVGAFARADIVAMLFWAPVEIPGEVGI
jgi:hypothetical protein